MISRNSLKRHMPNFARQSLQKLRSALNGPGIESSVLQDTRFAPDTDETPRLTLIFPSLATAEAFGGIMTALDLAAELRTRLADHGIGLRIVAEKAIDASDNVLGKLPGLADVETLSLSATDNVLPLRAGEMCMVYNWWISINLTPALAAQADHFGQPVFPRIHLIQEYEPQFYAFSSAHLLAHEAVGLGDALWAVFNTSQLHDYWARQGHDAARTFVFEPRMNAALRPFADGLIADEKTRTLLVYGRPSIARNAFSLIQSGLESWAATFGAAHHDWRIVSAGLPHDDIPLGNGHHLQSLGKLPLEDYAQLLRETSIGLSLMVSPHPSYPPLEMAHFGARVLTNAYTGKEPGRLHENLIALPEVRAITMAQAIEAEIEGFETDRTRGLTASSFMPTFLDPGGIDCADAMAEAIACALTGKRGTE